MKKKEFLITIIIGVIVICIGIGYLLYDFIQNRKYSERTVGTVVNILKREKYNLESEQYEYSYYYVVEYKVGEETIKQESKNGLSWIQYEINDKIKIKYNPNNIKEYIIKGQNEFKYLSILFISVGCIIIISGIDKVKGFGWFWEP